MPCLASLTLDPRHLVDHKIAAEGAGEVLSALAGLPRCISACSRIKEPEDNPVRYPYAALHSRATPCGPPCDSLNRDVSSERYTLPALPQLLHSTFYTPTSNVASETAESTKQDVSG
jgi:hypothetical protein